MANIKQGAKGDEVKKIQNALIEAGYDVGSTGADGVFGKNTTAAVKAYQQANGLTVDGIVGKNTSAALFSTPKATTSQKTQTTTTPATTTTTKSPYSSANALVGSAYKNMPEYDYNSGGVSVEVQQALSQAQSEANTPAYNAGNDENYQQLLQEYNDLKGKKLDRSEYLSRAGEKPEESAEMQYYNAELQRIYDEIINREKFSYDVDTDPLYQQYKEQYMTLGDQAMQNAIGQAAALTGGYGSSYAQSVGQQTYQGYLQQLNNKIPELYQMALNQYNTEGQEQYNRLAAAQGIYQNKYGEYRDQLSDYNAEKSFYNSMYESDRNELDTQTNRAQTDLQIAYDQGRTAAEDEYSRALQNYQMATDQYNRERDIYDSGYNYDYNTAAARASDIVSGTQYYNNVAEDQALYDREIEAKTTEYLRDIALASIQSGIVPNAETLKAAGISQADATAMAEQYAKMLGVSVKKASSSSTTSGSTSKSTSSTSKSTSSTSKSTSSTTTNNAAKTASESAKKTNNNVINTALANQIKTNANEKAKAILDLLYR